MARNYYYTTTGRYVTDLDPQAGELWAVIGPAPLFTTDLDPLPSGWEYLSDDQWATLQSSMAPLTTEEASAVQVPSGLGNRYTQTGRFN